MMHVTDSELEAYLEEALPAELMASIEQAMRSDEKLRERLLTLIRQRDQGAHTVGAIWRRYRLSCPTREQLGSYLLNALDDDVRDYVQFHLETVECRYCQASLADLKRKQSESDSQRRERTRRYFQSSIGRMRRD